MTHEHHPIRIIDPINNHEWEICGCGYAVDIHVMRGNCA
jgi:hypothetical protein